MKRLLTLVFASRVSLLYGDSSSRDQDLLNCVPHGLRKRCLNFCVFKVRKLLKSIKVLPSRR